MYMITHELKNYINTQILPKYTKNTNGHDIEHIKYVIDRSLRFATQISDQTDINFDMVYTIAAYHDLGHATDPSNHEFVSAEMLLQDTSLKRWFNDTQILVMYGAIIDHRASTRNDPSSIYGKIVSSADRSTSLDDIMTRSYAYHKYQHPTADFDQIAHESFQHIKAKFGDNGYAIEKMYFADPEYDLFLDKIKMATENFNVFRVLFADANNMNKKALRMQIDRFQPFNDQEIADKQTMLEFIDSFTDVVTRKNQVGHFTVSAFVVNASGTHAVMLHHKIMNDWIYPGGHADGEYDLCAVACREVAEETGLSVVPMFNGSIFALQSAPVKGHVKNGKYISAHTHYDILFVFKTDSEQLTSLRILPNENMAVEWWPIDNSFMDNNIAEWAKPVIQKIIDKLEMCKNDDKS